jgi:hypothetical protein
VSRSIFRGILGVSAQRVASVVDHHIQAAKARQGSRDGIVNRVAGCDFNNELEHIVIVIGQVGQICELASSGDNAVALRENESGKRFPDARRTTSYCSMSGIDVFNWA